MTDRFVIASGLSSDAKEKLNDLGIKILDFGVNHAVAAAVGFHSDLSFLFDGNDTLFVANEMSEHRSLLEKHVNNVIVIPEKLGSVYPEDVLLNCVVTGETLICNIDTVSETVLKYFKEKNYRILNVRQGYTKCSVVPVSDNAIITDDPSVSKVCSDCGMDVLFVSKGSVTLGGFSYGFIGGSAGRISEDIILFCGDITTHADYDKISDFLKKYNVTAVSLDSNRLYDIGSIIPIYGGF